MTNVRQPDIVRRNATGAPIAVVEIKQRIRPGDRAYFLRQLTDYLKASGTARYGLLVDQDAIEVFEDSAAGVSPWRLHTVDTLERYDHDIRTRRDFYEGYLTTLVNAWLDDLAYHFRERDLPEAKQLPSGLLKALRAA